MIRSASAAGSVKDDGEDDAHSGIDTGSVQNTASSSSGLCTVSIGSRKLVSLDVSTASALGYTLVAQGQADESEQYLGSCLEAVRDVMHAYLGMPVAPNASAGAGTGPAAAAGAIQDDLFPLRAIADILHDILARSQCDLAYLTPAGNRWVHLEEDVREGVDRALGGLEESPVPNSGNAGPASNGTVVSPEITGSMLVLGGSILHSRMTNETSRMLLHHLSCRPLGVCKLRTLPLFLDSVWVHVALMRMRHYTLVVTVRMAGSVGLARISSLLLEWEDSFTDLSLPLPLEESPVLLRHYTGHETLAFLYWHHGSGVVVTPPPRQAQAAAAAVAPASAGASAAAAAATKGAEAGAQQPELSKTLQVFGWFFARAQAVLSRAHVSELILQLKGYRFYGTHEEDFSLFVLSVVYTEQVPVSSLAVHNREILGGVMRHNGLLLAA